VGLKNWMAKNLAGGPSGYGSTMGREVVKNGLALGRILYVGHGARAMPTAVSIFEDSDGMKAAGFTSYCTDPMNRPLMEDGSELSKHLRVAGVTFAATCTFSAAFNYMKEANASSFTRSMGDSVRAELGQLSTGITSDLLNHYNKLARPAGITQVLNLEKPGTSDLLAVLLEEAVNQSRAGAIGFQRTGILGFDLIAVPLAEETVKMVRAGTHQFGW
jgi:hypothetical protein